MEGQQSMSQTTAGKDLVLLCPGQGSQQVGMGKSLFQEFKEVRETFEQASEALGYAMDSLCFEDPEQKLGLTEYTQPALLCVTVATWRALTSRWGVVPPVSVALGHSLGEYSALVLAGAWSLETALKAVAYRGKSMQEAVPVGVGAMAACLNVDPVVLSEICEATQMVQKACVEVVNHNTPAQLIISGHKMAVEKVCEEIKTRKLGKTIFLPVSGPFHSSLMAPAAQKMKEWLKSVTLKPLAFPVLSTADQVLYKESDYSAELLSLQICRPVYWYQCIQSTLSRGSDLRYLEIGAGTILQGLCKKILPTGTVLSGTQDLDSVLQLLNQN